MSGEVTESQADQINGLVAMVGHVATAHREAKHLYLDRLAPDYSVFDFIEPDEMKLSKILAWFLNPSQSHGQGSRFLRLFLESIGVNTGPEIYGPIEVYTEFPIKEGRLDILVKTPSLRLAIENKPWAGDQDQQLRRYFAHFDSSGAPEYRVIYLTPKGTVPPKYSICEQERDRRIKARQLCEWSYSKDILEWLMKCRAECRADRVSIFIDEFSRYIRSVFEGVKDRTMTDHLVEEIIKSPDKISGAIQIISLAEAIQKRLLANLEEQLRGKLLNYDIKLEDNFWSRYSGIKIAYSEQSPYKFGLEFQNTHFNGLVIGVNRKVEKSQAHADEYGSLVRNFGEAFRSDGWLWYRNASPTDSLLPVSQNWYTSAEPWIEIANGRLALKIIEAFTRTHNVLTACGVG